jgi:hypothetical protein
MPDNTEDAALRARHEVIIKDAEGQATAARRRVQAARLLLTEESKVTALEQTATAARQRVPSSPSSASSLTVAPPLVPTASSTYEDTVIAGLHLQAAAVLNVRQLVNIVLDSSTNYACWRDLMSRLSSATPYSSTVLFTLMLLFTLLFRVTARSMSTVASSRPWLTV